MEDQTLQPAPAGLALSLSCHNGDDRRLVQALLHSHASDAQSGVHIGGGEGDAGAVQLLVAHSQRLLQLKRANGLEALMQVSRQVVRADLAHVRQLEVLSHGLVRGGNELRLEALSGLGNGSSQLPARGQKKRWVRVLSALFRVMIGVEPGP